ncbi:MAG: hypothetical protein WCR51_11940 [Planctomycetia bacterium]
MAGLRDGRSVCRDLAAIGLALACVSGFSSVVDARPPRGPIMRAERRVARAQAALDRELVKPPARPRVLERMAEAGRDTAGSAQATNPRGDVARTAYEAQVPTPAAPAAGDAAPPAAREPAADGTYSVLVRPEGAPATPATAAPAQAGEPLRFPDASTP